MGNSYKPDFGFIDGEFINLYSEENPIMNTGEKCYFLFTNDVDYHRPLMAHGTIMDEEFSNGMNKIYYIKLEEFLETNTTISEFVTNKSFSSHPIVDDNVQPTRKLILAAKGFDFKTVSIKVEAFFARNTEEKIRELRKYYIELIRKDIVKQLADIDKI